MLEDPKTQLTTVGYEYHPENYVIKPNGEVYGISAYGYDQNEPKKIVGDILGMTQGNQEQNY